MTKRTKYYNLSKPIYDALFDKHVKLADVTPRSLFACGKKDKWAATHKHRKLLSDLLYHTDGRIAAFKLMHIHLRAWLDKHGKEWALVDSERSTCSLKYMMSALKERKRNHSAKAPLRFPSLQVLVDKMHDSDVENASSADDVDDGPDIEIVHGPRIVQVSLSSTDEEPSLSHLASADELAAFAQNVWSDDVCTPPIEAIPPSELTLKVDVWAYSW